ncbi:electron transport complex subunit RsxC [Treponema sp. R6D11]
MPTFKGGIHPFYNKEFTRFFKTRDFPMPKEIVLPLSQHIGARSNPIVKVGDKVSKGQLIAEAVGEISSNLHSPSNGVVKKIEPRASVYGSDVDCIIIETTKNPPADTSVIHSSLDEVAASSILEAVKKAGVCGLGGATFPTHVKMAPPADKKIEKIIINGAECEPFLTCDHRAMLEDAEELVFGIRAIMRATGAESAYIAVERNKMDAILTLFAWIRKELNIHIVPVDTKYPQGAEKNLIQSLFKKKLPPKTLPIDSGYVVFNVSTCIAVARAVKYAEPLTSRRVTIYSEESPESATYNIPLGTLVSEVLTKLNISVPENSKVILGGPMMGTALYRTDIPVTKGTSGIIIIPADKEELQTQCIRCGECVRKCPMNLMPFKLAKATGRRDADELNALNVIDCVECGVCSYICPAKLHLTQDIRAGKQIKSGK